MKYIILATLILFTASLKAQIFNDYPSSYQYAGIAAKNTFLLPADTVLTTAQNVDKCRQIAKKDGIIYSYSCTLNRWVPLLSPVTPNLLDVTLAGNTTTTNINIEGPGRKLTINSTGSTEGAQIQLFDLSGSSAFLQTFPADVPGSSWSQLVLQGDTNKIVTSNNLTLSNDQGFNYLTMHTDGRITGKPGTNSNDFATLSQIPTSNPINNQTTVAQSANFWISGNAAAKAANFLSVASSLYTPRIVLSCGSTLATSGQRFTVGLMGEELGSNNGSNFYIGRLSDAGTTLNSNVFTINRSTGNVGIGKMADPGSGQLLDVNGNIRAVDATFNSISNSGITVLGGAVYVTAIRTITTGTVGINGAIDHIMLCNTASGAITAILPDPTIYQNLEFIFKKITTDANTITISTPLGTIEGSNSTYTISAYNQSVRLINNGVNWYIL